MSASSSTYLQSLPSAANSIAFREKSLAASAAGVHRQSLMRFEYSERLAMGQTRTSLSKVSVLLRLGRSFPLDMAWIEYSDDEEREQEESVWSESIAVELEPGTRRKGELPDNGRAPCSSSEHLRGTNVFLTSPRSDLGAARTGDGETSPWACTPSLKSRFRRMREPFE